MHLDELVSGKLYYFVPPGSIYFGNKRRTHLTLIKPYVPLLFLERIETIISGFKVIDYKFLIGKQVLYLDPLARDSRLYNNFYLL